MKGIREGKDKLCESCSTAFYARPSKRKRFCCRKCYVSSLVGKLPFKMNKEIMDKIRKANTGKTGVLSARWKGGISKDKKIYIRMWRKANPKKTQGYWMAYSGRRRGADGSHSQEEWEGVKKQFGFQCLCCGRPEPQTVLTEDHVIPISKGGSNEIGNIQPLCKSCNSKKSTKIIDYRLFFTLVGH